MIDWKIIDETIDEAIEKDESYILFKFIEIEEYRYIQKVAEVRASEIVQKLNGMIFFLSMGITFLLAGITSALPNLNINRFIIFSVVVGLL